jgi:hypothetical protein
VVVELWSNRRRLVHTLVSSGMSPPLRSSRKESQKSLDVKSGGFCSSREPRASEGGLHSAGSLGQASKRQHTHSQSTLHDFNQRFHLLSLSPQCMISLGSIMMTTGDKVCWCCAQEPMALKFAFCAIYVIPPLTKSPLGLSEKLRPGSFCSCFSSGFVTCMETRF